MELMLLGPFEVGGPHGPVALGATKERLLLALLALRANGVVPIGQLIDGLWGEYPPPTALKTVHGHIARVRRILESAEMSEVLITREPGYFLHVNPEYIDATTFERRAETGRRALATGDPQTAARALGGALGLWRGDAMSDCRRESEAIAAAAVRLDELRLSAIEDYVDARLATGQHATVIGDIEELLVRHPLRERLWSSLMMALYLSQRQADALRAYQRARDVLVETLGIEPSPQLRRLEAAILGRDATLDLLVPAMATSTVVSMAPELGRPPSLTTNGPAFIGRDPEMEQMSRAWTRARNGERGCLLLGGEPGIGKTRLAVEVGLFAQSDGARVLYGRCDEGLGVPYQPFVEALRTYVETASDDDLQSGLGRYRNELVRLLPELSNRTSELAPPLQSDAATEQYRLFESVVAWLEAVAETTAHVLILDDLHWAASPTVLMLRHILQSEHAAKLLIIGTYRDSELDESHPLAAMLAESRVSVPSGGLQLLPLGGLDAEAVEAFVEAASGYDLGDAGRRFAHALHAETGGNPFFVIETVRSLVESGAIAGPDVGGTSATQWPDDVRVPAAARDVVLRRFARLTEDAQHTLTLAAVMGAEVDVTVLEEMVDLDAEPMLRALERATAAGLLDETAADRYTFAHAIIRSALYDRLSASRRVRLHTRVADAVERVYADDLGDHVSELAYHYADADPDKAVSYAIQAANAALDRLAFEDAVNIARRGVAAVERARGLRRPVSAEAEFDLLLSLGKAELRSGQPGRHTLFRACEIAEHLADGLRQAQSLLPLNRGFFPRVGRNDIEFISALERAIEAQPLRETPELAQLLAALASELVWAPDGDRRFALSDRAVAIARQVGDIRTLAHVLLSRSMTILAPDTLEERLRILEEVRGIAEELDDPAIRFDNAFAHGSTGWEPGQIDQVIEMQEMASALATELRQPRLEWQASSMETARHLLEGDLALAEDCAKRTLELGRRAGQHTEAFIFFSEQMLEIRRWQDRGDDVTEFKAVAGDDGIDVGFTLARQLYDAGEHEVARAAYARITQGFVLPPRRDPLTITRLHSTAYLASRFGDKGRAHDVYDALLPYADLFTSTTIARPIASHFLGMLAATFGRPDLAVEHLSAAIEAHERVRGPLFLAESKLELANVILESVGRTSQAGMLLGEVRAIATAHGAKFLVRRCDEILAVGMPSGT